MQEPEALPATADLAPAPDDAPWLPLKHNRLIRCLDVVIASLLCAASLPLLGLIALAIKLTDGGPVFFTQPRAGLGMKNLLFVKVRTMRIGAEKEESWLARQAAEPNIQSKSDPRITPLGRLLRRLSLDELPQFYLVLKGEMSLVGPRPLIQAEVDLFPRRYLARYRVLPGVTGLAQVSGRSRVSVWNQLEYDLEWMEHYSPALYLKILLRTALVVFRFGEAF